MSKRKMSKDQGRRSKTYITQAVNQADKRVSKGNEAASEANNAREEKN